MPACQGPQAKPQARSARETIEENGWPHRGCEEAREAFYKTCDAALVRVFRRQDGMRETEFRLCNETAGANDRTCNVENYFNCPYGKERDQPISKGREAANLWKIVEWYNRFWNKPLGGIPAEQERKWYNWNDPPIIEVTNLEDILKAQHDGRINKITQHREQYKKEQNEN